MLKLALWFGGLVAALGIGAWLWFGGMLEPLLSEVGLNSTKQEETADTANQQPQSELTTGTDTSDQALEDDLGALDAQLNAYSETSAELDQSLNDQPVTQEY
jgi:hypothetical protein